MWSRGPIRVTELAKPDHRVTMLGIHGTVCQGLGPRTSCQTQRADSANATGRHRLSGGFRLFLIGR
ncbi:hypothetical protein DPMN_058053 [Dreissena polymorpha]|uniref:Uncharacterized protein n=1 Tax=Dreissena polymorpha TaxID=45954 RepID=A0A9D4C113_DREPO|nr:hypothetical protein DPMN_058053 [Dreissena polymorpha]